MKPYQESIRVVIADDHDLFRYGTAKFLEESADIEVPALASNGEQLINQVEIHRPAVVITDLNMEGMGGVEATQRILRLFPDTGVMGLSLSVAPYSILGMLRAGAKGYVLKEAPRNMVLEGVRALARGEKFYCRGTAEILRSLVAKGQFDLKNPDECSFTPVELRILKLIREEKDSKAISQSLRLTLDSVKKHRKTMLKKAGVGTMTALVVFARERGICE